MAKLQKEFQSFHDTIKIGTYEENKTLRDKRDLLVNELTAALKDEVIPGTEDKLTFTKLDQGSYAMNTGIKPKSDDYDIDVGINFDIKTGDYESHKLKQLVFDTIDKQANRTVEYNRPCITVKYSDGYHVDLAVYANNDDDMRIAWGKKNSEEKIWFEADPKGLTKWVGDVSTNATECEQFRRCVRYLKKWKELKFSSDGNNAPPSVGLTIMARKAFLYKADDDLGAVLHIAQQIKTSFVQVWDNDAAAMLWATSVTLPVQPYKDVFYKMKPKQLDNFYNKITDLVEALEASKANDSEHDASKVLCKAFGDDFPLAEDSQATNEAPYVTTGLNA